MDTPAEMIGFAFYRRRLLLLYVQYPQKGSEPKRHDVLQCSRQAWGPTGTVAMPTEWKNRSCWPWRRLPGGTS